MWSAPSRSHCSSTGLHGKPTGTLQAGEGRRVLPPAFPVALPSHGTQELPRDRVWGQREKELLVYVSAHPLGMPGIQTQAASLLAV